MNRGDGLSLSMVVSMMNSYINWVKHSLNIAGNCILSVLSISDVCDLENLRADEGDCFAL